MSRAEAEVLVIGGGPVGLATAIAARQRGLGVTVIDSRRPPIDKPCGEGIMPGGVHCLSALGVDPHRIGGRAFQGIRYLDGEIEAEARFPSAVGLAVRRTTLHRALSARAEAVGATLRWNETVRHLDDGAVVTDRGRLAFRWLVGADGLRSRVRRWSGLEKGARGMRFGIRRHYACRPWSDLVEVYWADEVEAYVTPVADDEVGVAFLWRGTKARFDDLLMRFGALDERLRGRELASKDRGAGPLERLVRGVTAGSTALVGDAAGYVDAITGEGLTVGFEQALALADALEADDLGRYRRAHRVITRVPNLLVRALLAVEKRPAARRRLIATLAAEPALFARLLEVHVGERSVMRLGFGPLMRIGRILLAH